MKTVQYLCIVLLLIALTGCQQGGAKVEVVSDATVVTTTVAQTSAEVETTDAPEVQREIIEIDGAAYYVNAKSESTLLYNDDGTLKERNTSSQDFIDDPSMMIEGRVAYAYEDQKLIEEKVYGSGSLMATITYRYDNGQLVESIDSESGRRNFFVYDGERLIQQRSGTSGMEAVLDYAYTGNVKTTTAKSARGEVTFITKETMDADGNILSAEHFDRDGKMSETLTYSYQESRLVKIETKDPKGIITNINEYNEHGDVLKRGMVENDQLTFGDFFSYEYNDKQLISHVIYYRVQRVE